MIVVNEAELRTLLRAAAAAPTATSPLSGMQPAADRTAAASLQSKGALASSGVIDDNWRRLIATLADPAMQATIHVEGIGAGQYFGGDGGITGFSRSGQDYGVVTGLSVETILGDAHQLMQWHTVADAPPMRLELSTEEFTVLAALADAHREEQLIACIERRPLEGGAVVLEAIDRLVAMGCERVDHRWLVSVLQQFSAPGNGPAAEHVRAGVRALVTKKLASIDGESLKLGQELRGFATGLASTGPFMVLAVHAPWAEPEVKIFVRGVQFFWCIEFVAGRVRLSRIGGRAMDAILRQHLSPFDRYSAPPPRDEAPRAVVQAPPPKAVPVPAPATEVDEDLPLAPPPPRAAAKAPPKAAASGPKTAANCPKCGTAAKSGKRFCTKCGTSLVVA